MSPTPPMRVVREGASTFYIWAASAAGGLWAGFHPTLRLLLCLIAIDWIAAVISRSRWFNSVPYSQDKVIKGLIIKLLYFLGIWELYLIGPMLGFKELYIMAATFFCVKEGTSAWRHLGECGLRIGWVDRCFIKTMNEMEKGPSDVTTGGTDSGTDSREPARSDGEQGGQGEPGEDRPAR